MLAYRFKVSFEDQDDFLREIELRSDHTFKDFHNTIVGNLGLDPMMLSSFFICDHNYRKKKEISLFDMNAEPEQSENQDEDQENHISARVEIMEDSVLCDFIDDPHQKLMYVYDYINYWTFYIELIKIVPADSKVDYPRITRSLGPVPREFITTPQQSSDEEMPPADYGFEEEAYDTEDIRTLEGEEDFFEEDQENDPTDNLDEEQF